MNTDPVARECLVVIDDGTEVPGLSFYGLATSEVEVDPTWFAADQYDLSRIKRFVLSGETWVVTVVDAPIVRWGTADELRHGVRDVLAGLVRQGCRVVWVGAEGLPFVDPPDLFDPVQMAGGVLAWMTDDGSFGIELDPDGPLVAANESQMAMLRQHAAGLADR